MTHVIFGLAVLLGFGIALATVHLWFGEIRTAGRGRHVTSPGGGGPDGGVEAVTKNVTPSDPRPPLEWLSIKRELLLRAALDGETIDDAIEARAELLALEIVERGARSLHVRSDA